MSNQILAFALASVVHGAYNLEKGETIELPPGIFKDLSQAGYCEEYDEKKHGKIGAKKGAKKSQPKPTDKNPPALREDGPTLVEFVKAGYLVANYPPEGYKAIDASESEQTEAKEIEAKRLTDPANKQAQTAQNQSRPSGGNANKAR